MHTLLALLAVSALSSALAAEPVRVATWNIQTVGSPGTAEYDAALDVLTRIGANVVAIDEVKNASDAASFEALAAAAGYPYTAVAPYGPMGSLRTAVMSDYPIVDVAHRSSADLSGDLSANDISRYFLEVTVDVTGAGDDLHVVAGHWKSGWYEQDPFRRAVESVRVGQILDGYVAAGDNVVLMGDMNEEIDHAPLSPLTYTTLPAGLPSTWTPGADISSMMADGGLVNDPFPPIAADATVVDARQVDGTDGTRPASGRRLDYIWLSRAVAGGGVASEVFDCGDEALGLGLPKYGAALASDLCATASDHLPVFADVVVPTAPTVTAHGAGLLDLSEVMANPLVESTGEYVEIRNMGAKSVDLGGYVLDDGDNPDHLSAYDAGGSTLLAPGGIALVIDPGFAGDYTIPAGTVLLTTTGSAICNGLAVSDPISLYESDGLTLVDAWTTPFDPGNGVSAERTAAGWEPHRCGDGGTHSFGEAYCGAP